MRFSAFLMLSLAFAGCAGTYSWQSKVPERMRTVAVPVFRNESSVTEFGSIATRQLLREFQREGTFKVAPVDACALEIQGVVKRVNVDMLGYNRRAGLRIANYDIFAEVEISVVDKTSGKLLVDNMIYNAKATFIANDDYATSRRDASGRLAEDLARQVVDDVLDMKW